MSYVFCPETPGCPSPEVFWSVLLANVLTILTSVAGELPLFGRLSDCQRKELWESP